MEIEVPAARSERPAPTVPPPGWHRATVLDIAVPEDGSPDFTLSWSFRAEELDRRFKPGVYDWLLPHVISPAGLRDVLVDLGLAGQKVKIAEIVGRECMILVQSAGGRQSASISDTEPLPPEAS